jgi:L-aspartate semialdehyde sulfurtransferase ferredoxin
MACLSCHEICPAQAMEHQDIHVAKRLYIDRKVNYALERII